MSDKDNGETWEELRERSPLEYAATFPGIIGHETGKKARAELAALRAKAAELDRIADLIDPNRAYDTPLYDQISNALHDDSTAAMLRAENDAQARQLEQARIIFENIFKRDWSNGKINDEARAWLAANAPAPQTEQEQPQ